MPQVIQKLIYYTAGSSLFSCNSARILHMEGLMFVCCKNAANSYKSLHCRVVFVSILSEEGKLVICDNFQITLPKKSFHFILVSSKLSFYFKLLFLLVSM